eukprot:gene8181-9_t
MSSLEERTARNRQSMSKMALFESTVRKSERNRSFVNRKSDDFENNDSPRRIPFLTNDLYSLDLPTNKWSRIDTSGKVPSEIEYHNSVIHEDCMYTFGGYDGVRTNSLFLYNFKTKEWKLLKCTGDIPTYRQESSCCVYNDNLYIFGGWDISCTNDLYILDLKKLRYKHSAVIYKHSMYIFGGRDNHGFQLNDFLEFNIKKQLWIKIGGESKGNDNIPAKLSGHTAIVYKSSMYVFGGIDRLKNYSNSVYEFNFETKKWKLFEVKGRIPSKRYSHSAILYNEKMYIFGGFNGLTMLNEVYELDFNNQNGPIWKFVSTSGKICGRKGHSSVIRNDQIFIFGGDEKTDDSFNDKKILKFLSQFLEEKSYSDVQVALKTKNFYLHKFIISQSNYFKNMLNEEISKIDLDINIEIETFELIVKFMYTGEIKTKDPILLVKLIEASSIFEIEEISKYCYSIIYQKISIENVLPILIVSNDLKIKSVKDICFNFFLKNKTEFMKKIKVELPNELLFELLHVSTFMDVPEKFDLSNIDFLGRNLCCHILKLIENPIFSDLTIETQDQKFRTHKLFLSKVSKYFDQILIENPRIEKIYLEDEIQFETLKYLIEFIYKQDIDVLLLTLKELVSIIKMSDVLEIPQLLTCSAKNLQSFLSTENALEIMQCCVDYKVEQELEERCWRIVKSTHVDEISSVIVQRQIDQIDEIITVRNEFQKNELKMKEFDLEFDERTKEIEKLINEINSMVD